MPELVVNRTSLVLRRYWIVVALLSMIVVASLLSETFLSTSNILNILRQVAVNGMLAAGLTLVILVGGIDLSTGSVLQTVSMIYALLQGYPLTVALGVGLLFGVVAGLTNGILINWLRIEPFLVTLGMWVFLDGLSLLVGGGYSIPVRDTALKWFGAGYIGFIPVPVVILLATILVGHLILTQTVYGRSLYAIGGNAEASRLSGLNVFWLKVSAYTISGLTAAIAGIIMTGRLGLGEPTVGSGLALDAIAAAVVGGTRMGGGRGTMWGTLVGALMLGILSNIFNMLNVSDYLQLMAKGAIIVAAVGLFRRRN